MSDKIICFVPNKDYSYFGQSNVSKGYPYLVYDNNQIISNNGHLKYLLADDLNGMSSEFKVLNPDYYFLQSPTEPDKGRDINQFRDNPNWSIGMNYHMICPNSLNTENAIVLSNVGKSYPIWKITSWSDRNFNVIKVLP